MKIIDSIRVPPGLKYSFSEPAYGGSMGLTLQNDSQSSEFIVSRVEGHGFLIQMRASLPLVTSNRTTKRPRGRPRGNR